MAQTTRRELTRPEIASFCGQAAMLLKSGVTAAEALSIMEEDMPQGEGRDIVAGLYEYTAAGGTFTDAMAQAGCFPKYALDLARIGERSGRLDDCLSSLSTYYEREEATAKSVRSAVTYPLVMVAMMLAVVGVLVVKVLPIFAQVYRQLGAEMTGLSAGALRFGQWLGAASLWLLGLTAALVVAYFVLRAGAGGRAFLSRLSTRLVFTRKLNETIAAGRFAAGMSMMLRSGLDADEALEMVEALVAGQPIAERVRACRVLTGEGVALSEALSRSGVFSGVNARLVAVGFKTGAVDDVMEKIALRYEEEADDMLQRLIGVLEPTLVAVLSVLVGMILLSVMLPLMGVMSGIG